MEFVGHVARTGENLNPYKFSVGDLKCERHLEYGQQQITVDWNVTGCKHMDWIPSILWRDLVNTVMNKRDAHRPVIF